LVLLALTGMSGFACGMNAAKADGQIDIGGEATLATDYRFRGVSQTWNSPALQGSLEVGHESGWSTCVWMSNVDFVADGDPDDGARVETDFALGYTRALSDRFTVSTNLVHYAFPGTKAGIDYDYSEWIASFTVDDRHSLSFAYAHDVLASGEPGLYVAAATGVDLPGGLSLSAEIGHYDLHAAYGESYSHGSVALSGGVDAFTWQLGYHVTGNNAHKIFDESLVAPKLVLSLHLSM
jgi:uncharacterized protein (TIGR02001 family)